MRNKIIIAIICLLFIASASALDPKPASAADIELCIDYTPLVSGSADMQFDSSCAPISSCVWNETGTWVVDCSEYCNITDNTDITGNNVIFENTGSVNLDANITNFANVTIIGGCSVNSNPDGMFLY